MTHKRYENILKVIASTSSDLFGKEAVCKRVCMLIPEIRKDQAENYSRGCQEPV